MLNFGNFPSTGGILTVKVEVKCVLRIGSAHNNVRTSNVNIAQISNVLNFSEHKLYNSYSFRSIANQNGVRYSDSTSYFNGLDFYFKVTAPMAPVSQEIWPPPGQIS